MGRPSASWDLIKKVAFQETVLPEGWGVSSTPPSLSTAWDPKLHLLVLPPTRRRLEVQGHASVAAGLSDVHLPRPVAPAARVADVRVCAQGTFCSVRDGV